MRALIVTPDRDHHKGDWSGAFQVEADRLVRLHGLAASGCRLSVNIAQPAEVQRAQLLQALGQLEGLDLVAILCHGWRSGLQLGWRLGQVEDLARALGSAGAAGLKVALYACSTAADAQEQPGTAGDGGFADLLRDALASCAPEWSGWVDAHDRAGHCCSNPYVLRFEPPAGRGGAPLVEMSGPAWSRWAQALRDRDHFTLRLRYPLLTREQIAAEL